MVTDQSTGTTSWVITPLLCCLIGRIGSGSVCLSVRSFVRPSVCLSRSGIVSKRLNIILSSTCAWYPNHSSFVIKTFFKIPAGSFFCQFSKNRRRVLSFDLGGFVRGRRGEVDYSQ